MGRGRPRKHPVKPPVHKSMPVRTVSSQEAEEDDEDVFSDELGMDYERIEYPKEVYDQVCGRKRPEAEIEAEAELEEKTEATLSQDSQETDMSLRGRKRVKKQVVDLGYAETVKRGKKKNEQKPGKPGRKRSKSAKKEEEKMETTEEEEEETEESSSESESDTDEVSSRGRKKKRNLKLKESAKAKEKKKVELKKKRRVRRKKEEEEEAEKVVVKRKSSTKRAVIDSDSDSDESSDDGYVEKMKKRVKREVSKPRVKKEQPPKRRSSSDKKHADPTPASKSPKAAQPAKNIQAKSPGGSGLPSCMQDLFDGATAVSPSAPGSGPSAASPASSQDPAHQAAADEKPQPSFNPREVAFHPAPRVFRKPLSIIPYDEREERRPQQQPPAAAGQKITTAVKTPVSILRRPTVSFAPTARAASASSLQQPPAARPAQPMAAGRKFPVLPATLIKHPSLIPRDPTGTRPMQHQQQQLQQLNQMRAASAVSVQHQQQQRGSQMDPSAVRRQPQQQPQPPFSDQHAYHPFVRTNRSFDPEEQLQPVGRQSTILKSVLAAAPSSSNSSVTSSNGGGSRRQPLLPTPPAVAAAAAAAAAEKRREWEQQMEDNYNLQQQAAAEIREQEERWRERAEAEEREEEQRRRQMRQLQQRQRRPAISSTTPMASAANNWSRGGARGDMPRGRAIARDDGDEDYEPEYGGASPDTTTMAVANTPISPVPDPRHYATTAIARLIPTDFVEEQCFVPWRFIPIDDVIIRIPIDRDAVPVRKCRALLAAGPFETCEKRQAFQTHIQSLAGFEVEFTRSPNTSDAMAMKERTIAAVMAQDEEMVKALLADGCFKVDKEAFVPVGKPLEVVVTVSGTSSTKFNDEEELMKEITDELETNYGRLVELIRLPDDKSQPNCVFAKARFFYAVHATRACAGAPMRMSGGREVRASECPPERRTNWIRNVVEEKSTPAAAAAAGGPQPVPPPSAVSLSEKIGPLQQATPSSSLSSMQICSSTSSSRTHTLDLTPEIKQEPGLHDTAPTGSAHQHVSFTLHAPVHVSPVLSASSTISKFSSLPPPTALPPPGLVDPFHIRRAMVSVKKETDPSVLIAQTIAIPPIAVPSFLIPLPPTTIPPPIDVVPILPYPDLPPIDHHYFPPVEKKRGAESSSSGTSSSSCSTTNSSISNHQKQQLKIIDPATFIRPFESLLPPRDSPDGIEDGDKDGILLFARPMDLPPQQADWDAVRDYFKDEDCSSRIFGGILSLRFTGEKAREKAQVLLLEEPHDIQGRLFSIKVTYSVLFEASHAVAKTRLYEEISTRFGSVVEVEKKCDSAHGKPVYKVYFEEAEVARAVALEGVTVDGNALRLIGRVP